MVYEIESFSLIPTFDTTIRLQITFVNSQHTLKFKIYFVPKTHFLTKFDKK